MKPFWLLVCATLTGIIVVVIVAQVWLPRSPAEGTISIERKVFAHFVTSTLVLVVWAVRFRPQVERFRVGLFALFTLVTLEAVAFWYVRTVNGP